MGAVVHAAKDDVTTTQTSHKGQASLKTHPQASMKGEGQTSIKGEAQ